jgi:hypothetical protein
MDAGVLLQARDFILHLQLATLQFRDPQGIAGRVRERLVEFFLERLVPTFKFRKVRLYGHGQISPSSDCHLTAQVYTRTG